MSDDGTSTRAAFTRMPELDAAWRERSAGERLAAVRGAAPRLRARLVASGRAAFVDTFDLVTLPYPASFAFGGAAATPLPFIMMTNRMQLVQFVDAAGETKTLLFNPTDVERSAETPFFRRLQDQMGQFVSSRVKKMLEKPTTVDYVKSAGLSPDDVDYVAFDHLHTQDLRRILGTRDEAAQFPRAKLVVWRPELDILRALHPLQRPWFLEDAIAGVAEDRFLVLDDGDWLLGAGVALVRTPGHTVGNWSLALSTDTGVWVVSENGVACDNYAPEASRIAGVRRHARRWGVEVVLNSNTLEGRNEQYTSMVLEKTLADPCRDDARFCQHFSSSELTATPFTPGLSPTYAHRRIRSGALARRAPAARAAAEARA
ncbi:MAG TPA: hypothetical protein VHB21_00405 [Minicystis sp.]|nr:hypothetical protein [Minicystis sp.]